MFVTSLDLISLRRAYAGGLTPRRLIEHCLAHLVKVNDPGIFIALRDKQEILADCDALESVHRSTKPLWGVPFAVKDNIDVAGMETTAACPEFAYAPAQTAEAVVRLQAAGAVLVGKTNLDQFATGLVGLRTPYPAPRNAFDPALVPGGSSSGSAVAVAQGIVSFALGTDTAGSGRVPAALNNIVGLKPSLGLVSTRGVFPACKSLDCVSIFALTVDDAWDVFACCAGYDDADPRSRHIPLNAPERLPAPRIGVPDRASRIFFDDKIASAGFDDALRNAAFTGSSLVEVDLSHFFATAALLYGGAFVAERYAAIRAFVDSQSEALHPTTRKIIEAGRNFSAADLFNDLDRLVELRHATAAVWRDVDMLVVPSIPTIATCEEVARDPIGPNNKLGTYTNFVNLLDLCALAVPGPFRSDGRAAGITLIAPAGDDARLAGFAREFHAHAGVPMGATKNLLPTLVERKPVVACDDMIEIVVVGAHMSGLALNGELLAHGATFVRETQTAPCYKLFALPGGPPYRPGLLRVADGEGEAIAVEVWALPVTSLGRFMADIPPPLAIGTLCLADGSVSVKGFLCEPQDLLEARDISRFGGWRAYLAAGEYADGR